MKLGNYCILCTDQKNYKTALKKFGYSKMETISVNSKNSKASEPDRFRLD